VIIRTHLFTFTVATAAALSAIGCSTPTVTNTNSATNSNAVLASNSAANANSAAANTTAANSTSTGQAPDSADSPSATYRAAYTARKNKDIAGLKKLFSKDVLEFLTMLGKADPKKPQTLDQMLKELCEQPQAATAEARNEKITGDKATIEYLDEKGSWETMDFVREDGAWKLTIDKPEAGPDDKNTGKK
jgi:type IV secretory pathway VirB10-like protein